MSSENFELGDGGAHETEASVSYRADSGRAATMILIGCSILQLPIWGFVMSYGVLQEQYTTQLLLSGSSQSTGVIGTTLNGVLYMSLPFLTTLFAGRLYHWRRIAGVIGLLISGISLIVSASSTAVWHLVVTQGVFCGLGSALVYGPTLLVLDEWFIRRKSFAYSVLLAVKNLVGTGTPFLTPALISGTGLQNTLRIWGVITIVTGVLAMPMMRPRGGTSTTTPRLRNGSHTSWKFLTHPTFYIFHLANIFFSSGYGLPQTYLPSYARQVLNLPAAESSLMLALFNVPGIFSCLAVGALGDGALIFGRFSLTPYTITAVTALGSALAVLLLWGLAAGSGVVGLAFFSAIYGFFAGAYSSTWGGAIKEIEREAVSNNEAIDTGIVYGMLNGGRGIGFVVGGVIGVELLNGGAVQHRTGNWGYSTDYGGLILYTGLSAAVGGWSILWSLNSNLKGLLRGQAICARPQVAA